MPNRKCQSCGAVNFPQDSECRRCGVLLVDTEPTEEAVAPAPAPVATSPAPARAARPWLFAVAGALAVVLAGAAAVAAYWLSTEPPALAVARSAPPVKNYVAATCQPEAVEAFLKAQGPIFSRFQD